MPQNHRFIDPFDDNDDGMSTYDYTVQNKDMIFKFILQCAGPILFIALQLSCVSTANGIIRMKSVRQLSSVPFVSLLVCGYYWTIYGSMKNDMTVMLPNASAMAAAVYCMWAYYLYAKSKPSTLYWGSAVLIAIATLLAWQRHVQLIGMIGCALSVAVSGSPLVVVRTVIRERSTAALPFSISMVAWLNAACWVAYGYLLAEDVLIYGPNLLSFLLATLQLLLFVVYGFPKKSQPSELLAVDHDANV